MLFLYNYITDIDWACIHIVASLIIILQMPPKLQTLGYSNFIGKCKYHAQLAVLKQLALQLFQCSIMNRIRNEVMCRARAHLHDGMHKAWRHLKINLFNRK